MERKGISCECCGGTVSTIEKRTVIANGTVFSIEAHHPLPAREPPPEQTEPEDVPWVLLTPPNRMDHKRTGDRLTVFEAEKNVYQVPDWNDNVFSPPYNGASVDVASSRLKDALSQLECGEHLDTDELQESLKFAISVLGLSSSKPGLISHASSSFMGLEGLDSEELEVPCVVREWLTSTFTQRKKIKKRQELKPSFKSVVHVVKAGLYVDRIYRQIAGNTAVRIPLAVQGLLKSADEWTMDVFHFDRISGGQTLRYLTHHLMNKYDLIQKFKIPETVLDNFLVAIQNGYETNHNPYHNSSHGADVTQTTHYILWTLELKNYLSDLEILSLLFAAIIHDYEHTGTTNAFHIQSHSEVAILYNDRSVLENHHLCAAFRLLKKEDLNVVQHLSTTEYKDFRILVIDAVMATDMSLHFEKLKKVKSMLPETRTSGKDSLDRSLVLQWVLHCADISHPSKEWTVHRQWTDLVLEEFFEQGDREKEMGLDVSPLCDRNTTMIPESQVGFIDFIVGPAMEVCGELLDLIMCISSGLCLKHENEDADKMDDINSNNRRPSYKRASVHVHKNRDYIWSHHMYENRYKWKEQCIPSRRNSAEICDQPASVASDHGTTEDQTEDAQDQKTVENKDQDQRTSDRETGTDDQESTTKDHNPEQLIHVGLQIAEEHETEPIIQNNNSVDSNQETLWHTNDCQETRETFRIPKETTV